jgi:hypothetical protein
VFSSRARKSGERNVKAVKKSEEVEGYEGDKDVNTLLLVRKLFLSFLAFVFCGIPVDIPPLLV